MREAWCELMFAGAEQAAKATRDPVAPAKRSPRTPGTGADTPSFELFTTAGAHQQRASALIRAIHP